MNREYNSRLEHLYDITVEQLESLNLQAIIDETKKQINSKEEVEEYEKIELKTIKEKERTTTIVKKEPKDGKSTSSKIIQYKNQFKFGFNKEGGKIND